LFLVLTVIPLLPGAVPLYPLSSTDSITTDFSNGQFQGSSNLIVTPYLLSAIAGRTYLFIPASTCSSILVDHLTIEDGTDVSPEYVRNKLPTNTMQHSVEQKPLYLCVLVWYGVLA
jgi:hypothetical protein